MPEQQTQRGQAVTRANFDQPFETLLLRLGVRGLNLQDELDVIPPDQLARFTNGEHDANGAITSRPGQTSLATGGTKHHSMRILRDPQTGAHTRIWGTDTDLRIGLSGALSVIDSGYSGNPLALTPDHPPLSGDPWMFVGDSARMRKVRADGLDLPIGLPAPSVAATAVLGTEYRRGVAAFDSTDGTQAANWTGVAGKDTTGVASGTPTASDEASPVTASNCVAFFTVPGGITTTYDSWWVIPITRTLATLSPVSGAGDIAASDDDILHLWMKASHPHLLQEVRVYIICSASVDLTKIPGSPGSTSTDAYVKSFRRNDFAIYAQATQPQVDAAATARLQAIDDDKLKERKIDDDRASWEVPRAERDPNRARAVQAPAGSHQWIEFGSIGISLRRGDFQRLGTTTGRDWSTVTGVAIYLRSDITTGDRLFQVNFDDLYLTGGFGPDTVEPGAQQLDWRYTNYDPRSGAESNGSPIMSTFLDSRRQSVTVTPAAFGDAAVRQRFYRRGGSLIDNWFFEGVNSSDGGAFADILADDGISAAGTLPIDHFQPVPTVNDAGTTVLAQPLRALWGPIEGMLLGCGDPYRPGHLYHSNPDEPDHWSSSGNVEVCSPGEELMNGGIYGHQAFVFSRERLYFVYPNLTGSTGLTTTASQCKRGLVSYWAFAVGAGGIYFVAQDGFFQTNGGPEEWLSKDIDRLFKGKTRYGLLPIDFAAGSAIRVTVWESKVYFGYQDTSGARQTLIYSILNKYWRHATFGKAPDLYQGEEEDTLVIGSLNQGASYTHSGFSDAGTAIAVTLRTGVVDAGAREEKLLGDEILDADRQGETLTLVNYLNEESTTNPNQSADSGTGRQRYIFDPFGDTPQRARSLSVGLQWSSSVAAPVVYRLGFSAVPQPELTVNRVTSWDDLSHGDEVWLSGVTFDCDTGNIAKSILIERDYNGVRDTVATLSVNANGRHKLSFSWAAVPARQVRVRPSDACKFWLLYRADWIFTPEPPRIAAWDIHFENAWDQYYTGLDLYCDTSNLVKQVEVYVDETRLSDPATGLTYFPVQANGRRVVHLTLPWGRGHVFRFRAVDSNPGLLYSHRWHLEPEPSEQANWNQNFSVYGTRADKYLKAVIFECDTFGQNKSVGIEADGVVVETLSVNANGRKVVQKALTTQQLGRVWRVFPSDGNPGRAYSIQPIFDEEPFKLPRWETQETNHDLPGWFQLLWGHVTHKSTQDLTLRVVAHSNQTGGTVTKDYTIPHSNGVKRRSFVSFEAGKMVLVKYLVTSPADFHLYREETVLQVQPWGSDREIEVHPFGDDDLDPTRPMKASVLAAAAPGGSLGD
jgi:hypothetical protein